MKCEICGKEGFHKLSCTNNTARVAIPMEIKHLINDVYQVVAFKRLDFKPTVTPSSTEVVVTCGYNIPTT